MSSNAVAGVGTVFKRLTVAIAEVNTISGPSPTKDMIDVTSLDSTGGYREFIGGFKDGGEVTFSMNFTLAGYNQMLDDFKSSASRSYSIVLPDAGNTTLTFNAHVTKIPLTIKPDDKITCEVTLRITGALTLTT